MNITEKEIVTILTVIEKIEANAELLLEHTAYVKKILYSYSKVNKKKSKKALDRKITEGIIAKRLQRLGINKK